MGIGNSKQFLPNSEDELNRRRHAHDMIRKLAHGNFNCPVEEALQRGIRVLDAGCFGGGWTLEMANDFGASQFTGIDRDSHVWPKSDLPPNCEFRQADILRGLPFPDNTFDFVFQRSFILTYTRSDWPIAIAELIRVTKPGGWVELLEFDAKVQQSGPTYDLIRDSLNRTCLSRGIDLSICQHLDQLCTELECVQSESLTTPLRGRRGREAVESMRLFMMAIWERIAPEMGVRKEEYQQMMAQAVNEFSDNHAWMRMWCVYGMKPSR